MFWYGGVAIMAGLACLGFALGLFGRRYGARIGVGLALLIPLYAFSRSSWGDDSQVSYGFILFVFFSTPLIVGSVFGRVVRYLATGWPIFRERWQSRRGGEADQSTIDAR